MRELEIELAKSRSRCELVNQTLATTQNALDESRSECEQIKDHLRLVIGQRSELENLQKMLLAYKQQQQQLILPATDFDSGSEYDDEVDGEEQEQDDFKIHGRVQLTNPVSPSREHAQAQAHVSPSRKGQSQHYCIAFTFMLKC